jgi:hypothetical protein
VRAAGAPKLVLAQKPSCAAAADSLCVWTIYERAGDEPFHHLAFTEFFSYRREEALEILAPAKDLHFLLIVRGFISFGLWQLQRCGNHGNSQFPHRLFHKIKVADIF